MASRAALDLATRWQGWPEDKQQQLLYRMRAAAARRGKRIYGDSVSPGELAQRLDPDVVQRDYLEQIDAALRDIRLGVIDRLIVECPPQVGKTARIVWSVFDWLTWHPRDPIILASYGADLAAKRGRMVRTLVERHGAPYGLLRTKGQWARNNWETTAGGAMRTCGMDTGITGEPAAFLVIDDPHKNRADADSKGNRDQVWDTYSSSLLTRLRPGAPIVMILTRWHEDDLAGRVLVEEGSDVDGGRWRVLRFPAIAWFAGDLLGRALGEPLQHPWIDQDDTAAALAHWEEKRRTTTLRDWFALFQCNPQPSEGALLTPDQVKAARHRGPLPPARVAAVAVDPSGGGRDVAGVVGGILGTDKRCYVTHDRSGVMSSESWSRVACELAYEITADRIIYEHNYGGDAMRLAIRTAWKALQDDPESPIQVTDLCPRIVGVTSRRGKVLRAEPIAQQVLEDNMRFAGIGLTDVEREWTTWQSDSKESPGRIDASVHLAFQLIPVPGSETLVSTVADKPKEPTGKSRTAQRRITR